MNILFLSGWYPWPADNGAKIRIFNLLKALVAEHDVTLVAARDPSAGVWHGEPVLERICRRVVAVPWLPRPPHGPRRLLSFAWPMPEWVVMGCSPEMRQAIATEVEAIQYDLVVAHELVSAVYARHFDGVPALLEDIELGGFHSILGADRPLLRRWRGRIFWWKLKQAVASLLRRFNACTVVSESERRLLASVVPGFGPVEVIPNCIDYGSYQGIREQPQPNMLVFLGSLDFDANYEAVCFFLRRILPLVRAEVPDVRFQITGKYTRAELPPEFRVPGVRLTGHVDDIRPLIAGSWVNVVPLITGGGTRFKILEAMALGTPVVSTTKGAEGLAVENGRHLLLADSAEGFAAAVVSLCRDAHLRSCLVAQARSLVAEKYDWSRVAPKFLDLVERISST